MVHNYADNNKTYRSMSTSVQKNEKDKPHASNKDAISKKKKKILPEKEINAACSEAEFPPKDGK